MERNSEASESRGHRISTRTWGPASNQTQTGTRSASRVCLQSGNYVGFGSLPFSPLEIGVTHGTKKETSRSMRTVGKKTNSRRLTGLLQIIAIGAKSTALDIPV